MQEVFLDLNNPTIESLRKRLRPFKKKITILFRHENFTWAQLECGHYERAFGRAEIRGWCHCGTCIVNALSANDQPADKSQVLADPQVQQHAQSAKQKRTRKSAAPTGLQEIPVE